MPSAGPDPQAGEPIVAPGAHGIGFFVLGAQKCATSWLYYCLRDHPDIQLHRGKDEDNTLGGARYRERGAAWFESLYEGPAGARVRGAVSVDYLPDRELLARLLVAYPQARFIVSVREPVARMVSAYRFLARRNLLPAQPLNEALLGAREAYLGSPHGGLAAELVARGLYAQQLEPLIQARATERLLVVDYDFLVREPRGTLARIYEFVGADPDFRPPSLARRPKRSANLPWLDALERRYARSRPAAKLLDLANRAICRLGLARAALDPQLPGLAPTRALFADDIARLERLLDSMPSTSVLFAKRPIRAWS